MFYIACNDGKIELANAVYVFNLLSGCSGKNQ